MNGVFKPQLMIHNNRRKEVNRKKKDGRGKERSGYEGEESDVSCVGSQLKDRGDWDCTLIFKTNNQRG